MCDSRRQQAEDLRCGSKVWLTNGRRSVAGRILEMRFAERASSAENCLAIISISLARLNP